MSVPGAIVLGGGQSQRMGTDKASLVVDGISMLERVVNVASEAGVDSANIAIVAPGFIADPEPPAGQLPKQGPLAGVVAGWRSLQSAAPDPVLVLSCDLPALTSQVLTALIAWSKEADHGALAFDGERNQPLIAAYRPVALELFDAAFQRGERSLRACFEGWDIRRVSFPAELLADADVPEDLVDYEVRWPKVNLPE